LTSIFDIKSCPNIADVILVTEKAARKRKFLEEKKRRKRKRREEKERRKRKRKRECNRFWSWRPFSLLALPPRGTAPSLTLMGTTTTSTASTPTPPTRSACFVPFLFLVFAVVWFSKREREEHF
jgi:hypothetical protein